MVEKILVSACFLGKKVRFDGGDNKLTHHLLDKWKQESRIVSFCPEVAGGLKTPRSAAEILYNNVVFTQGGDNVSDEYIKGALKALEVCKRKDIKYALLKESSPSCGSTTIYDGSFSNHKIFGEGITVTLLRENGIKVFSEYTIEKLANELKD